MEDVSEQSDQGEDDCAEGTDASRPSLPRWAELRGTVSHEPFAQSPSLDWQSDGSAFYVSALKAPRGDIRRETAGAGSRFLVVSCVSPPPRKRLRRNKLRRCLSFLYVRQIRIPATEIDLDSVAKPNRFRPTTQGKVASDDSDGGAKIARRLRIARRTPERRRKLLGRQFAHSSCDGSRCISCATCLRS